MPSTLIEQAPATTTRPKATGKRRAKSVLIVESTYPIETLSGVLFTRSECVLTVASTAAEALGECEACPPDLVIYDAQVDDFSARDFIQALRSSETCRDVPVLVFLADEDPDEEDGLVAAGAAGVATRAEDEISLSVKVCELLGISLRRHVRSFVRIKADTTVRSNTTFATIANISLGGALLETADKLPAGEFIKLRFSLPGDDRPFAIIARVVRDAISGDRQGYGCQFMDLNDYDRGRIHDYIVSAESLD